MTIDQPPENDHNRRQGDRCEHGPKEPRRFVEERPGNEEGQHSRGRDRQLQDAVRPFQERIFIRPFRGAAFDPEKGHDQAAENERQVNELRPVPRDVGAQLEELRAERTLAALDQIVRRFLPQLRAPDRRAIPHKQPADGGVLRRANRSDGAGNPLALLGYVALFGQDGSTPFLQRAFSLRDLGQDVVDPLPNLRRSI